MSDIIPIKNAILSVYYKEGIVDMARTLRDADVRIFSSGGTADALRAADIEVTSVQDYTGLEPMFDHRVATLHPALHAGILFRRNVQEDRDKLAEKGWYPIDLVVVNMYPVQEAIKARNLADVVKKTDIGGPTLLRGAAKNYEHVAAVVDPHDYMDIANKILRIGGLTEAHRMGLAAKLFRTTGEYDAAIGKFLTEESERLYGER